MTLIYFAIEYLIFINAWRACTRGLQYLLCVCVCLSVPSLLPSNGAYTTKWNY